MNFDDVPVGSAGGTESQRIGTGKVAPGAELMQQAQNNSSRVASMTRGASSSSLRRSPSGGSGRRGNSPSHGIASSLGRLSAPLGDLQKTAPFGKHASPNRQPVLYRLIGTTSTRAAKTLVNRVTILGDEGIGRRLLQLEEAQGWQSLAAHLCHAAVAQHIRLSTCPTSMPLTNLIDGVPLLASVFIPPHNHNQRMLLSQSSEKAQRNFHSSTLKAAQARRTEHDGVVVVKNRAYNAVRDAATVNVHRDPTSPPSHTPLRYPGGPTSHTPVQEASMLSLANFHVAGSSEPVLQPSNHTAQVSSLQERRFADSLRQFDAAVSHQKRHAAKTYTDGSLSWMPHDDVGFLYKQWQEFLLKWSRRAGATPSSLMASFLCTMLIDDDDSNDERAEFINRTVMEETLEIVCDASAVSTPITLDFEGHYDREHTIYTSDKAACRSATKEESAGGAVTYTEFCYVLRNIAGEIFPVRDPVAAVRLLASALMDRYHRVHY